MKYQNKFNGFINDDDDDDDDEFIFFEESANENVSRLSLPWSWLSLPMLYPCFVSTVSNEVLL